jgi:hypothetical protein
MLLNNGILDTLIKPLAINMAPKILIDKLGE